MIEKLSYTSSGAFAQSFLLHDRLSAVISHSRGKLEHDGYTLSAFLPSHIGTKETHNLPAKSLLIDHCALLSLRS